MTCYHQCTGKCRREGCNCECGEFHCDPNEKCRYEGEECPNHPKSLHQFLNNEQKMFIEHVDMDYIFKDYLSSHDSRLIAKIREMIPTEKIHQLPDNVGSYHETEHDRGWNDYRKALLSLLPDNTNVCEK